MLSVAVCGLGFVGLTTALGFAQLGHRVYGFDADPGRVATLRSGAAPFAEPHLSEALRAHLGGAFQLAEARDCAASVAASEYVFYCVGTPYGAGGAADLSQLFAALDGTLPFAQDGKRRVLVVKSTVPPGTTGEKIAPYVREKAPGAPLSVACNPEFLREGHCWDDFLAADRIVLGCEERWAEERLRALYAPLGAPVCAVSPATAEFVKYLSNTLLATLISYANEMARVADAVGGVDIARAFRILHLDKRWDGCAMTGYVYPGCGYGGYCLPKDTSALYAQSRARGFEPRILREVIAANEAAPKDAARRIERALKPGWKLAVLGLSFKPGSDDVRDAPAARIIRELAARGRKDILVYDPQATEAFCRRYGDLPVVPCQSARQAYERADAVALVTAWPQLTDLLLAQTDGKPVVDCRYALRREEDPR